MLRNPSVSGTRAQSEKISGRRVRGLVWNILHHTPKHQEDTKICQRNHRHVEWVHKRQGFGVPVLVADKPQINIPFQTW